MFSTCYTIKLFFRSTFVTYIFIIFYRKQLEIGVERDIQRQEQNKLKSLLKQQTQLADQLRESSKNEKNLQTL